MLTLLGAVWAGNTPDTNAYKPVITECSSQLLTHKQKVELVRNELNRIIAETSGLTDRIALRALKLPLRNRVLEQCMAAGACSTQDYIRATHEIVERLFNKNHKIKTNSRLIAISVGTAAATTLITSGLPKEVAALTTLISVYVSNAVWEFGAPFIEPSLGRLRRKIFSSVRRGQAHDFQTERNQQWGDVWQATQATLTPPAQWGRSTVFQYLTLAVQRAHIAHQAIETYSDPVKARSYAADQFADLMFFGRTAYSDISKADKDVANAITSTFTNHVADPAAIAKEVWAKIAIKDPDVTRSMEVANHYKDIIHAWFNVRL